MSVAPDKKESFLTRQRRQRPWLDHLVRAGESYTERYGNHYAAAITYFSVLSLFPLIMIAFAIAGFVLAGNADLLREMKSSITDAVPSGLGRIVTQVNLRDALTAQWGLEHRPRPFVMGIVRDLLALLGLGLALGISFGLSAAGSGLGDWLLKVVGLSDDAWALFLLRVATIVLSLAANWVVFLWVLSRLPREAVSARSAMRGAVAAAIGFEILKQGFTVYLEIVMRSPSGTVFGPLLGLMVFANIVSRFLLFITAWTATATENRVSRVAAPEGAVISPRVLVRSGPTPRGAVGLLGVGAVLGLLLGRRRSRD